MYFGMECEQTTGHELTLSRMQSRCRNVQGLKFASTESAVGNIGHWHLNFLQDFTGW